MLHLKPRKFGTTTRMSFARIDDVLEMPNLIEVQTKSYEWFLKEGIDEVLREVSPIVDHSGTLSIDFVSYSLDSKPRYSVEECKDRDVTYDVPLRVSARLTIKETGEVKQSEIFMCSFPLMTEKGTFIINGTERVVVSQVVRSPGMYYAPKIDVKTGKHGFTGQVVPYRGAWLEYETDALDVMYVKIDKNRKLPVTVFVRALGEKTDEDIYRLFGDEEIITATEAIYDAGARTILAWGFHASESNNYRSANPVKSWQMTLEGFRRIKDMERDKILAENRRKFMK